MSSFFKIRRVSDGLYFKPKWGATGFHKHGKVYGTAGAARGAWKLADKSVKGSPVELVEFAVVEKSASNL